MFYYKKGDIITTIPWTQPQPLIFDQWLEEWLKVYGVQDYNIFLTGAFCQKYFLNENIDTWDIDIILRGEVRDEFILKDILNKAVDIGFKHKLLIDIVWRDKLPEVNLFSQEKIITYTSIIKKSPNDTWEKPVLGEIYELISGLYKVKHNSDLAHNKFKIKNYTLPYKKLKT